MNRASAADLRKAIAVATELMRAGILFVPVPVLDEADHSDLIEKMAQRLEQLGSESEEQCAKEN